MISKKILKIAKWLWSVTVVVVAGYYLITNWDRVAGYLQVISPINLTLSFIFLIGGKLLLVFLSKYAVESEGIKISYLNMFGIVSLTQLGKYLPGGLWHFVWRFNVYHEHNLSFVKTTKAIFSENVWLLSGAGGCFITAAILSKPLRGLFTGICMPDTVLVEGCVILILVWVGLLWGYERIIRGRQKLPRKGWLVRLICVQVSSWMFLGISFAFVFPEIHPDTILLNIGVYAISWVAGYIAIFAPGGIGVREATLALMLTSVFLPKDTLVYAFAHRFLYIAVELAFWLVALILNSSTGVLVKKLNDFGEEAQINQECR